MAKERDTGPQGHCLLWVIVWGRGKEGEERTWASGRKGCLDLPRACIVPIASSVLIFG